MQIKILQCRQNFSAHLRTYCGPILKSSFDEKVTFFLSALLRLQTQGGQEMLHSEVMHKVGSIDIMKTLNRNVGVAPPTINLGSRWR